MEDTAIEALDARINNLIQLCETLREENYTLRQAEAHARHAHQHSLEKNQQIQSRLETLLVRLKATEE